MPSGGLRIGAGRRRKDAALHLLHGVKPGKAAKIRAQMQPVAVVVPEAPAGLPEAERAVWDRLAPHAAAALTLTEATVPAFVDLCEAIVVKADMQQQIARDGYTYQKVTVDGAGVEHVELKPHPLLSQHRGHMVRVEAGLRSFMLMPMGKPIGVAAPVEVDPFAEFEAG